MKASSTRIHNRRGQVRSRSPFRMMRAILMAVFIITVALALFELDVFPHRKAKSRLINKSLRQQQDKKVVASPEQVLLEGAAAAESAVKHEEVLSPDVQDAVVVDDVQSEENHQDGNEDEEPRQEAVVPAVPQQRKFVMTLGRLKNPDGEGTVTTGQVIFQTRPDWAPIGVAHLHKLLDAQFFDAARFFRVVPGFIVQFGISGDPVVQKEWRTQVLSDDPVQHSNIKGTITFATSGPNTRTTQMFINLADNAYLDKQGFSPVAEIVDVTEVDSVIVRIEDKYREKPNQGKLQNQGNTYVNEAFPDLSYIVSIRPYEGGDKQETGVS